MDPSVFLLTFCYGMECKLMGLNGLKHKQARSLRLKGTEVTYVTRISNGSRCATFISHLLVWMGTERLPQYYPDTALNRCIRKLYQHMVPVASLLRTISTSAAVF
jgi:hypothetical protein